MRTPITLAALVKDGQRVFTRAQVYVGKPDIDFFFNDENQKSLAMTRTTSTSRTRP